MTPTHPLHHLILTLVPLSVTQRQVVREQGLLQALEEASSIVPSATTDSKRGLGLGLGVGPAELPSLSSSSALSRGLSMRGASLSPTAIAAAVVASSMSPPTSPLAGRTSLKQGLSVRLLTVGKGLDDGKGLAPGEGLGMDQLRGLTLHDELSRSRSGKEKEGGSAATASAGKEGVEGGGSTGTGTPRHPSLSIIQETEEKGSNLPTIEPTPRDSDSPLPTPALAEHTYLPPEPMTLTSSITSSVDPSYLPGGCTPTCVYFPMCVFPYVCGCICSHDLS